MGGVKGVDMRVFVFVLIGIVGCATTTVYPYVGDPVVYRGTGGAVENVDGIEIWKFGVPAKPFRIVGYIDDKRGSGIVSQLSKNKDLSIAAKSIGANAVIILSEKEKFSGFISNGVINYSSSSSTGSYSSISTPVYRSSLAAVAVVYQ